MKILFVFLGGGLGSLMRYGMGLLTAGLFGAMRFPVATLACNVLGCFLIGLFGGMTSHLGWSDEVRLLLTVGLCGGFTTFSTFSNEGLAMLHSGHYVLYVLYALLSVTLGLAAVWAGASLMRHA